PPLTPVEQASLQSLTDLLQSAQNYSRVLASSGPSHARILTNAPGPDRDKLLVEVFQKEAAAEADLLQQLLDYAAAKVRAENPTFSKRQVNEARDKLLESAIVLAPGEKIRFVNLVVFVADQREAILRSATEHAGIVREAGSVFLRMRATMSADGQ